MRRKNGDGTVVKMTGNRRKPYACRKIVGWTEEGRPKIKYISYHRTRREAEKALAEYNDDPYRLGDFTLGDIYEDWIRHQDDKSENTRQSYKSTWKKLEPLSGIKIQNIDRFELQIFFDKANFTKNTLKQARTMIKMLFEYAVKRGILPISALQLHKAVEYQVKLETRYNPHVVISEQEIERLWKHTDNDTVKIILVYIYTGLRYVELHNLSPEDAHDDYIEIRQSKTEAGKRIVPLSDKVKSLLPIDSVPAYSSFRDAFIKALPDHTPHDTRHTFISMMVKAGVDDRTIKAIVGHKSKDITDHYTHIPFETLLEAVNRI